MSLRKYLKDLKIDQIEDDEEFCDKEYEVVMKYCTERRFLISDDDLMCISSRDLLDSYKAWYAEYIIKDLWMKFGDIPINPDTKCIDEEWNGFAVGTHGGKNFNMD